MTKQRYCGFKKIKVQNLVFKSLIPLRNSMEFQGPKSRKSFRFLGGNPQSQIHNGFTLVELLIAVAISSIVFLAIISTYSLTLKTLDKWDSRQEDYYLARNVFRKMRSEISSAYFITDSQAVSTLQEKTDYNGLEGDEKTFSFYTTAKSLYFPFTCLTKVTYKFILDDEDKGFLIREEEPLVNFTLDEHKYLKSYVWSDNLKNFNFKYSDGKDWLDSWDIQQTEKILKAVKIELISSHEEKFSTIIYIPTEI